MARVLGSYPTDKVIYSYIILGGILFTIIYEIFLLIDGLIILYSFPAGTDSELFQSESLIYRIQNILQSVVKNIIGNAIPFFITGFWLAVKKFGVKSYKDYLVLFGFGFIIATIYEFIVVVFGLIEMGGLSNQTIIYSSLWVAILEGLNGGICCVILGKAILPKIKK